MTFDQLTADQQALLTAFVDGLFRPIEGDVNRSFAAVQHMLDSAAAGVSALLADLDQAAVLPMNTGLAGAQPRAVSDIVSALATYTTACASFNTDAMRQSRIISAGISATAP